MNYLAHKNIVIFFAITTLIMATIVMVFVNPMIDGKDGLGVIKLQLSFFKDAGEQIISSWDIGAFRQWIFTDYLYALSYALFFASIIVWLEKIKAAEKSVSPYIAILAGFFDWIENSLELWFLDDMEGFSSALFLLHSVFATLKWLALPVILWRVIILLKIKDQNAF